MSSTEAASSSPAPADKKMIVLRSSDGETFSVEEKVAVLSHTIKNMVDDCDDTLYPLPNVKASILAKVIEYCKRHAEAAEKAGADPAVYKNDDLNVFDQEFVNVDQEMLYDLIMASNYLDVKGLLDLTTQRVADMIKGKTPEEIRKLFNIENDFTPEEEKQIREENMWAFE